jgi:CRP-like cAMP-binding protein
VDNQLLDELPASVRERIIRRGERVPLAIGAILCEPGQPFEHAFFPLSAFISLVARVEGHAPLEMGLIGNEGMLGATLALGVPLAPSRGMVQGEGEALRLPAKLLQEELRQAPALVKTLSGYLYVLVTQQIQATVCTRFHEVEARLSRWLLMTHDRVHANHFHLTHQFLADMLGVQRSAVTIAAGGLQARGIIHYTRGEITVLDRPALEAAACECYAAMARDYAQIFGSRRTASPLKLGA